MSSSMGVVDTHQRTNEAIDRLNVAIAEQTRASDDPDDGVDSRPLRVRPLPDVDSGTVEGCDAAFRAVDDRIAQLLDIEDGPAVEAARDEALTACRDLRQRVGEHRGQLSVANVAGR